MFFSKPIQNFDFNDVVDFCKTGVSESIVLDYKQTIPNGLNKVIASFANTIGGHIIIGVADLNDKPKPPFDGITRPRNFLQTLEQHAVDKIDPPVFMETKVVEDPSTNKVFAVLRIPQSISAPHIVDDSKIFVRTGQSKKPESIIEPTKLKWISNMRNRSEELRDSLINSAQARMNSYLGTNNMVSRSIKGSSPTVPYWQLMAIPIYPEQTLFNVQDSKTVLNDINIDKKSQDPIFGNYQRNQVSNGLWWGGN